MESNEYLGGRSPEQDEAADDVEPNPDAGVPADREPSEPSEPLDDPGAERPRHPQAGL